MKRLVRMLMIGAGIVMIAGAFGWQSQPVDDPDGNAADLAVLNEEAIARARAVLAEVARTYREAAVISDEVKVTRRVAGREQVQEFSLRLGPGTDGRLRTGPHTFVAHGDQVHGTHDDAPSRYFQAPLIDGLLQTLRRHPGGFGVVVAPNDALRRTSEGADPTAAFNLGMPLSLQVAGYEQVEVDGHTLHQVHFLGRGGVVQARIDPATNLVRAISVVLLSPGAPTSSATRIDVELSPRVLDHAPAEESLVVSGRMRVDQIRRLVAFDVGDVLPAEVELVTPEGARERLGDRRGRAVVLDFWAASCGSCMQRLPITNELARWALASGAPIDVLGVYAREGKAEDRPRRASVFWARKEFLFPTLIDPEDKLARGLGFEENNGLVVLGRDGGIRAIVHGAPADLLENLIEIAKTAAAEPAPSP